MNILFVLFVLFIDYKGKFVLFFFEFNCVFLELWIVLRRYFVFGDVYCKLCMVIEIVKIFDIFWEEIDFGYCDLFCIYVLYCVIFKLLFK